MSLLYTGGFLPFCVGEADPWDGTTYFTPSGGNPQPSASASKQVAAYGAGSLYPFGRTLDEICLLYWQGKNVFFEFFGRRPAEDGAAINDAWVANFTFAMNGGTRGGADGPFAASYLATYDDIWFLNDVEITENFLRVNGARFRFEDLACFKGCNLFLWSGANTSDNTHVPATPFDLDGLYLWIDPRGLSGDPLSWSQTNWAFNLWASHDSVGAPGNELYAPPTTPAAQTLMPPCVRGTDGLYYPFMIWQGGAELSFKKSGSSAIPSGVGGDKVRNFTFEGWDTTDTGYQEIEEIPVFFSQEYEDEELQKLSGEVNNSITITI